MSDRRPQSPAPWSAWLYEHRWPLALWLTALAIRVHWNLEVHPPTSFDYSDMHGYLARADQLLDDPYKPRRYAAFFPFGTSWLLAVVKYWFGRENHAAIGIFYAVAGSLIVPLGYGIAKRSELGTRVAKLTAVLLTVYYPLIGLGGYTLSEVPASLALCLALWCTMRLSQQPSLRWALSTGASLGIACAIRSQMVVNIGLMVVYGALVLRKSAPEHLRRITWRHLCATALPLLLCLGLCSYRVKHHTGHWGLVSTNGPINLIFGRCHTHSVSSRGKNGWARFAPPPMIQLNSYGNRHKNSLMKLNPIFADYPEPVEGIPGFKINGPIACKKGCKHPGVDVQYDGYIGDTEIQNKIVRACIERGGIARQIWYSIQHCILLWDFNTMWPDSANPKPRPIDKDTGWRALTHRWRYLHNIFLMIPSLVAAASILIRPKGKTQLTLIALNFVSVLLVAMLVMGGPRFRAPYDPLIVILALGFWDSAWRRFRKRSKARSDRRAPETNAD